MVVAIIALFSLVPDRIIVQGDIELYLYLSIWTFDSLYQFYIDLCIYNNSRRMQSTPVICGIDIGSWTFKISSYDGQKFEVLTN